MAQFLGRVVKIGTAVTRGTEPAYAQTFTDPLKPVFKLDVKTLTYDAASGKKGKGFSATFEILSVEAFGETGVDGLIGTSIWAHVEPDGAIGANNPAMTIKDFNLLRDFSFTGDIETGSTVRYWGEKQALLESDIFVKDITP